MNKFLQSKAGKVIVSILVLFVGGVLGDLSLMGFSMILNSTAETSDTVYTIIYSIIFWALFIGLFKIKKWHDLKWARRLYIFAPIILILVIMIGGAVIVSLK